MDAKLNSRKFWFAVLSFALMGFWGSISLFTGRCPEWMPVVMGGLSGVAVAYVGVQGLIDHKKEGPAPLIKD